MRCLTLADALQQRGAQIRFVSRQMIEHLQDMLAARGHEVILLNTYTNYAIADHLSHAHWLGTSQHTDAHYTVLALSDQTWDWLVVDHYALDARWESALRGTARRILVIDDLADRVHDCDVLLDQNFYADMGARYIGKVSPYCQLLLGPRYALLREEFHRMSEYVKPRTGLVKRVLVFLGGVDPANYTARAIEAIASTGMSDVHVDVVIGLKHPFRQQIEAACALHGFRCHVQTNRMAELMAKADLSIGACGSATWERCSMGVPSIVLVLADNQRKAAADLHVARVLLNLGDANQVTTGGLASTVAGLIADEKKRSELSKVSLDLVAPSKHKEVIEILVDCNS